MKKINKFLWLFALLLLAQTSLAAVAVSNGQQYNISNDSATFTPNVLVPQDSAMVSVLYIITVASPNDPAIIASSQPVCPQHSVYSNGSSILVPSMPGLTAGPSGVYMWQCILVVSQTISTPTIINYSSLDPNLANPELTFSLATPSWEPYAAIADTSYTAYQFPNNAFVPIGIGGSGLGCGGAGGSSTVTCNAGGVTLTPYKTGGGQWIFYVQPSSSIVCQIHRDYGRTRSCYGGGCPCNQNYTLNGGQAWVGACCYGAWHASVTNFNDPNFNTCGGGC